MKKRSVSRGVPAILLTLLLVFGILPAQPSQAAETIDMRVSYQLDGVRSVSKGMPFGAYFFFYLPGSYSPPADAKVTVSASGVALSKKSFTLQDTFRSIIKSPRDDGTERIFILDVDGNRYEIPNVEALDRKSYKKIELYL